MNNVLTDTGIMKCVLSADYTLCIHWYVCEGECDLNRPSWCLVSLKMLMVINVYYTVYCLLFITVVNLLHLLIYSRNVGYTKLHVK